ncbi:MAG: class I SAM-dependent methyltransferase [Mycobacteriaceae bacterium]|nr:class I SAM-dependent methyltransferase [Mycobacteriaceae bacterium]
MNWGYEEDPPMELPLPQTDEPNRYAIQLYHRVATQADLTGKRVLEVGCGHGGGASYLARSLGPESYVGMDLNRIGIDRCRERHDVAGLEFCHGNAEELPFADETFDAVINVESSHCYPHFDRFLTEVARVLRPGGDFLYADVRARDLIPAWERDLNAAPLRIVSKTDISDEVAAGMEKNMPQLRELSRRVPTALVNGFYGVARRGLQESGDSYRVFHLVKAS